ncbi:hypothetical protein HDU79_004680 [Rhizoclosmatium sp. JEL0117]|nr:hypothetical protein HDU79_004680 [Rhizoclosmatium sp. JEL0117]
MHAIIAGSGLVGALTAFALKQVGIESTLYDQVDLVNAAMKSGGGPVVVEFGESGDAVKVSADCGETDPALRAPVQIMRSKLHSIFIQACQKAGIKVFTGKKIVGVTEIATGVIAQFADGTTAVGDFLVGADGIHSATRRAIFGESTKAEFTGVIGHIGVIKTKEHGIDLKETLAFYIDREKKQMAWAFKVTEELGAVQVMTFNDPIPVEGEEYRPYSDLPKESTRLADMMASWGVPKHVEEMMRKSFRISPAAIYDLKDLPTFHKGRVVLLGDSAHGMVPNAGLGLLTGIEDVGVLLELFRHYQDEKDIATVFNLYSQLRVPRGHDASLRSREMAKQYYTGSSGIGHFKLRVGIFLFNHNLMKYHNVYDCPAEVNAAIKATL